jgi:hypothetical protein
MTWLRNWKIALVATLTLGLAPFGAEPHLFGKVRWILGGAKGMQPMDWFDFVLHGSPVVYLIIAVYFTLKAKGQGNDG